MRYEIIPFLMFLSSADLAVCGRFFMQERKADEENGGSGVAWTP